MAELEAPRFADLDNLAYFKERQDEQNDETFAYKATVPIKVSELENDADYKTGEEVATAIYKVMDAIPQDVSKLYNDANYQTGEQVADAINTAVTSVYRFKGSVSSIEELPQDGNEIGDVYDVAGGMNYAWDGNEWDSLGDSKIEVDASLSDTSTNPVQNKVVKEAIDRLSAASGGATGDKDGLMSAEDKKKLDSLDPPTKSGEGAYGDWPINITGSAATASKIGAATVGSAIQPIYLDDGSPKEVNIPRTGNYFNGLVQVRNDGAAAIGKYIDFHNSSDSQNDYDVRLMVNSAGNAVLTLPDKTGTIALTSDIGSSLTLDDNQLKYYLGITSSAPSNWDGSWKTYANR